MKKPFSLCLIIISSPLQSPPPNLITTMTDKQTLTPQQSRTVGALLGLHAGDSLGATLEFQPHAKIAERYPHGLRDIIGGGPFSWPAGHATDDTDMTRAVLLAYRDAALKRSSPSKPTPVSVSDLARRSAEYFVDWYEGNWPGRTHGDLPKDIGGATERGITNFRSNPNAPSGAGQGSAGNGSLMRCLPTALFQPDLSRLVAESQAISAVTHDDTNCVIACAAYNACAAALVAGASPSYAVRAAEAAAIQLEGRGKHGKPEPVTAAIRVGKRFDIARAAAQGPPLDLLPGGASGYVLETLIISIAAVLDQRSLEDILVDVVRIGKDTDTNGAVAGGLLGARDGESAIPRRWKHQLQFGLEFRDIALEILEVLKNRV
jgi:ADP-ribosylglycohydrolase